MRRAFTLLLAVFCISIQPFAQFNACSQWTWMKGGPGASDPYYGTRGQSSSSNRPGARVSATSWQDPSGKFWLFGGGGYNKSNTNAYLNDVWRYDPATNQ